MVLSVMYTDFIMKVPFKSSNSAHRHHHWTKTKPTPPHLWCLCVVSCFQEMLILRPSSWAPNHKYVLSTVQVNVPMSPAAHCGRLPWTAAHVQQLCVSRGMLTLQFGRHPQQRAGLQISLAAGLAMLRPPVEAPAHPQVHAAAFCPAQGGSTHPRSPAPGIFNASTLLCPQHDMAWTPRSSDSHHGNFYPLLLSVSNTDK